MKNSYTHTHLTKMHPLKFNISSWKIMIGILFSLWWYFFLEGGSCSISGVYLCFTRCTVAGHSGRPAIQTSIQNPPKLRFDMTGTPLTRYLKRHIGPNNLARKNTVQCSPQRVSSGASRLDPAGQIGDRYVIELDEEQKWIIEFGVTFWVENGLCHEIFFYRELELGAGS